jgi:hypothetical protein
MAADAEAVHGVGGRGRRRAPVRRCRRAGGWDRRGGMGAAGGDQAAGPRGGQGALVLRRRGVAPD